MNLYSDEVHVQEPEVFFLIFYQSILSSPIRLKSESERERERETKWNVFFFGIVHKECHFPTPDGVKCYILPFSNQFSLGIHVFHLNRTKKKKQLIPF